MSGDGLRHFEQSPNGKESYLRSGVGAGQNTGNAAPPRVSRDAQARGKQKHKKHWLWEALLIVWKTIKTINKHVRRKPSDELSVYYIYIYIYILVYIRVRGYPLNGIFGPCARLFAGGCRACRLLARRRRRPRRRRRH